MVRTIVSLEENDKKWLDRYSNEHAQSTAETIRAAIKEFQKRMRADEYRKKLKATFGLLKGDKEDSVEFVRKIRAEWD